MIRVTRFIHQNLQSYSVSKKQKQSSKQRIFFSEYFAIRARIILTLGIVYMLTYGESKSINIIRVAKYDEYDVYTTNFEYEYRKRINDISNMYEEYK